jgi:hypothetical protein
LILFISFRGASTVPVKKANVPREVGCQEGTSHRLDSDTERVDAGVPVHVVAARCGHDPAVLLHSYAKRTKKADTDAANKIGKLLGGALSD